jgi:flagellin-like hook-associated protein FlgL
MASNITLSAGVRQNLLALQNTASLLSVTQNRLATGKKVNSALDNPTNFFTSSALSARSSDLSSLLDSMSNGINTLKAADNGITAITTTVQTLKATVTQARQDASFKSTSYTVDATAIGTATLKNLTISGGEVGTTPVDIALNAAATATTLTGTGANFGTDFTGGVITVNGANVTIRGDSAAVAASVTGAGGSDLSVADPDLSALDGETITIDDGTNTVTYTFTNAASGQKADLLTDLNANGFTVTATAAGLDISRADGVNFTVTTSDSAVDAVVGVANNTTTTNGVEAFDATAATVEADFDTAGITGLTASVVGGQVVLSLASGADVTIAGDDTLLTAIGFASGNRTSTNGVEGGVQTVDQLVTTINAHASLTGKVKASNDGGKLNIQNLSTLDLTVVGAASTTINGGTGSGNTVTVGGNTVRANLITQFNDLRTQLDKIADDSSFNGVNLLRGDTLKIVFNENNTSSISIVAQNANGINSSVLGVDVATATEFASNTALDTRLDELGAALTQLRSQASAFGSNLSIVQNRQEFTKSMITTLQVGADALVLADSNEEAANLLALQTRQQLSTTALSLASQADQAVLRLF